MWCSSSQHRAGRGHPMSRDERGWADSPVARSYPCIACWVHSYGWIEIGEDLAPLQNRSFIRALDEGGLIWAGDASYPTLDHVLRALESALATWFHDQFRT